MSRSYQERYEAHQARKREQIVGPRPESAGKTSFGWPCQECGGALAALYSRRSQRVFTTEQLTAIEVNEILDAANHAPSSCNRHGVRVRVVTNRATRELLSGVHVGAVGWAHRAPVWFVFIGDPSAYPSGPEWMPYADVGFTAMAMWLAAEALGLGACYVNPNVNSVPVWREALDEQPRVQMVLLPDGALPLGALVVGHYDWRPEASEEGDVEI